MSSLIAVRSALSFDEFLRSSINLLRLRLNYQLPSASTLNYPRAMEPHNQMFPQRPRYMHATPKPYLFSHIYMLHARADSYSQSSNHSTGLRISKITQPLQIPVCIAISRLLSNPDQIYSPSFQSIEIPVSSCQAPREPY